jgi:hypothetical protein
MVSSPVQVNVLDQLPPKRRTRVQLPPLSDVALEPFKTGFEDLSQLGDDASPFAKGYVLQGMYTQTGKAKLAAVKEYVKGLCSSGCKFIIFAAHLEVPHINIPI